MLAFLGVRCRFGDTANFRPKVPGSSSRAASGAVRLRDGLVADMTAPPTCEVVVVVAAEELETAAGCTC